MDTNKKFYLYLSLAIAETIVLIWFSFIPSVGFVPTGGFLRPSDLEHFVAYAVYGFLWQRVLWVFMGTGNRKKPTIFFYLVLPLAIGSLVGAACETIQFSVPTRVADPLDWAVDTLGSFCGAAFASKLKNVF